MCRLEGPNPKPLRQDPFPLTHTVFCVPAMPSLALQLTCLSHPATWPSTCRPVRSNYTPTVLGQELWLQCDQADTVPDVNIVMSWVQSVECREQIRQGGLIAVRWSGKVSRRKWHIHWIVTGEQTFIRQSRGRNLLSLRNHLPPALRPDIAECVWGTARKPVWLQVRMGKGPKRKLCFGFYSEYRGNLQEDLKQRHDRICLNNTISIHLTRPSACH